jgi:hypothetical protein
LEWEPMVEVVVVVVDGGIGRWSCEWREAEDWLLEGCANSWVIRVRGRAEDAEEA